MFQCFLILVVSSQSIISSNGPIQPSTTIVSTENYDPATSVSRIASTEHIAPSTADSNPTTSTVSSVSLPITAYATTSNIVSTESLFPSVSTVVSTDIFSPSTSHAYISSTPSSTVVPSSSAIITTPKTSTTPIPDDLNVTVTDSNGNPCLWLDADIRVEYQWMGADNKTKVFQIS